MSRIQVLEHQIRALTADELVDFRRWFEEFDAEQWDRQIEDDVRSGKLDALADAALRDHKAGSSSPL